VGGVSDADSASPAQYVVGWQCEIAVRDRSHRI
jgi:hypothetical protein